ncbi:procathepsin L-like [Condylostylus longicornis]|uniref:procathepsin L-like n=1 Tax=Condylostylus longicornis TaxID=2530218 RepID=UPI00244DBD86|nr:procathepsin L-like [Condylostylus longicornis]
MKLFLVALFALIACQQSYADLDSEWENFKIQYGKVYNSYEEEATRKETFANTLKKIEEHNKNYAKGLSTFEMGVNEFADFTVDEYKAKLERSAYMPTSGFGSSEFAQNFTARDLPEYVNWLEYGYRNPVLNQGGCGSCYTFAAIAALEGQYYIKHGQLIQLAHQELLDCGKEYGNYGCGGGFQRNVYNYMLAHGLGHAASNPYLGREDVCRRGEPRISISTFYEIPSGDEQALKQAVATVGPIPIDMDASLDTFMHYKSGVFYDSRCRTNWLSHAITIVGYGTENGQDYWLVRNSWGDWWGDNGYIKMARNRNNHCGVATRAVYPIVN